MEEQETTEEINTIQPQNEDNVENNKENNIDINIKEPEIKEDITQQEQKEENNEKELTSETETENNTPLPDPSIESVLCVKTQHNKGMEIDEFFKQKRHYFIMTDGGTPIYSRYGDELKNSEILATFSAIITKFTFFNTNDNFAEKLNYISNENSTIVFYKKGKIFFIALSNKKDQISLLYSQLEYLWYQLLSIITAQRVSRLEEKPVSFVSALQDTEELFEQMIDYTSKSLVSLISSYHVLPLENRNKLNNVCDNYLGEALMCCLFTPDGSKLLAISKNEVISVVQSDIILIQNLIMHNDSLRFTESWVPICLPGISEEGFVQLYANFTTNKKIGIVYITESQENALFLKFCEQSRNLIESIEQRGLIVNIENALECDVEKKECNNIVPTQKDNVDTFMKILFNLKNKEKVNQEINVMQDKSNINNTTTNNNSNNKDNNIIKQENNNNNKQSINYNGLLQKVYNLKQGNNDPFKQMKYCIFKHKTLNQYFSINFNLYKHISKKEKHILKKYIKLYDLYCSQDNSLIDLGNYFHLEKDSHYAHIIYTYGDDYLMMGSLNLFMSTPEIIALCKDIFKIVKLYENNFFINVK